MNENTDGPVPPQCHNCGSETVESRHAGVYVCTDCQRSLTLEVKSHVKKKRWLERADDPSIDVLQAWKDGVQMDEEAHNEHRIFSDEIRYHHETTTILIRKDVGITTVLDYRQGRPGLKGSVVKALLRADVDDAIITDVVRIGELTDEQFRALQREVESPRNDYGTVPLGGGCTVDELLENGKIEL